MREELLKQGDVLIRCSINCLLGEKVANQFAASIAFGWGLAA
jgi:hypothetical protein